MAGKIQTLAYDIADALAEKMNLFVVDIQFKKEGGKQFLRIFIDKAEGVGIDDCESFSRAFEEKFDSVDPIDTEYTLEVSSPGADRQLKTEREFTHYIGKCVDVKLYKAEDGKKEFSGILVSFDNDTAKINSDGQIIKVNIKEAAYIKLHFEF